MLTDAVQALFQAFRRIGPNGWFAVRPLVPDRPVEDPVEEISLRGPASAPVEDASLDRELYEVSKFRQPKFQEEPSLEFTSGRSVLSWMLIGGEGPRPPGLTRMLG